MLFVTRLKDNAEYGAVEKREVVEGSGVIRDEVILLTSTQEAGPEARLRRIEVRIEELKQSLRIETFVGTSANAVMIQIWTALVAMLLARHLQMQATYGWSVSNLVDLLRQQLFVYRDLTAWLDEPFLPPREPPAALQLAPAYA